MKKIIVFGIENFGQNYSAAESRLGSFQTLNSVIGLDTIFSTITNRSNYLPLNDHLKIIQHKGRIIGYLKELKWLFRLNQKNKIHHFQIYNNHLLFVLWYRIIAFLLHKKIILHYVELRSSWQHKTLYQYINGELFDRYVGTIADGAVCISNIICNNFSKSTKPYVKIPPLVNQSTLEDIPNVQKVKQIVYIGSIGHFKSIENIISAFSQSNVSENYKLIMIISGDPVAINLLKQTSPKGCEIFSKLTTSELLLLCAKSQFGLIPLENTVRDAARFPNKISEYCLTSTTIITTPIGDLKQIFKEDENAIFVKSNEREDLVKVLDKISNISQEELENLRLNTFKTYKNYFSVNAHAESYLAFLKFIG